MGFGEAVRLYFKNYVKFDGRSRRAEYWWPVLFLMLISVAGNILAGIFAAALGDVGVMIAGLVSLLLMLFSLATIIPSIAVGIRRLHDLDKSGWWLLICLIPFIGAIVLIIFFVQEGTKGPNKFGSDPKGGAQVDTF